MNYGKTYGELKNVAQQIREGKYQSAVPESSGLMRTKRPKPNPQRSQLRTVADYFAEVSKPADPEEMDEFSKYWDKEDDWSRGRPKARPWVAGPVDGPLSAAREALGKIESSGNYQAIGPVVEKGMYKGQRAYGKYQVMEGNIGPWTKKVLGRAMTKEEFLADEAAQDAVVEWKLAQEKKKHGSWEDAASVWFSGRPLQGNTSDDGYTSVPDYVRNFQVAFNSMNPVDIMAVEGNPKEEKPFALVRGRK